MIDAIKGKKHQVLTSWLGEGGAQDARHLFAANRIPTYETPNKAVRAFMHLVRYRKNQELLMETPASTPEQFKVDEKAARAVIDAAIAEGRGWLSEFEAKQVLEAYGIPVVETLKARNPDEAADAARRIGKPVALKILSVDIIHKSDIGGVQLISKRRRKCAPRRSPCWNASGRSSRMPGSRASRCRPWPASRVRTN